MSYEALRQFADSWGLLFLAGAFVCLIGWTFRPGAQKDHRNAAEMIFEEDREDG